MKPIILKKAIHRISIPNVNFRYDYHKALNVVTTVDGEVKKFIEIGSSDLSLLTKTKVLNESDDDSKTILQMATKTLVRQERDDDENPSNI